MTANLTTATIAGHTITLISGHLYIANRPMMSRPKQKFIVSIKDMDDGKVVARFGPLSYDDANAFLAAFNNGQASFEGRMWD